MPHHHDAVGERSGGREVNRQWADPAALEAIRERLFAVMWDDAGIVRNSAGLERADNALRELAAELTATSAATATAVEAIGYNLRFMK